MTEFSQSTKLIIGEATHPGEVGKNNEDDSAHFTLPLPGEEGRTATIAVVADGIGGNRGGEEASRTAVQTIKDYLVRRGLANPLEDLAQAVSEANRRVFQRSQESSMWTGMGTTLTVVAVVDGKLFLASVGDSRAYLIRNGEPRQLTTDHTWAQEMIEAGRMSPEEAMRHPNRNVLKRYLGVEADVEVDLRLRMGSDGQGGDWNQPLALVPGDTILLCTDGLSDLVDDHDIATTVTRGPTPQRAADRLVNMARARGGYDNVTLLTLCVPGGPARAGRGRGRLWAILGAVAVLAVVSVVAYQLLWPADEPSTASPTVAITALAPPTVEATATSVEAATVAVAAAGRTATATPLPTATPTLEPMSDIVLTPSPTPGPTPAPSPTSAPVSAPTRPLPTPSPVPGATVVAPRLVEPADDVTNSRFLGDETVVFRWEWPGQLADNQWFDVGFKQDDKTRFEHTKQKMLELHEPPIGFGTYEWWVRIAEFAGHPDEGGKFQRHISVENEHWRFRWDARCHMETYKCNCRTVTDPITREKRQVCDICQREVCE